MPAPPPPLRLSPFWELGHSSLIPLGQLQTHPSEGLIPPSRWCDPPLGHADGTNGSADRQCSYHTEAEVPQLKGNARKAASLKPGHFLPCG